MSATYLGGRTLGETIPGLAEALGAIGDALNKLRAAIEANSALMQSGLDALSGAISDLDAAKNAIIGVPFQAVQEQLTAVTGLLDELKTLTDASQFLNKALAAIDEAKNQLLALAPTDFLEKNINQVQSAVSDLGNKVSGFQDDIEDLTSVSNLTSEGLGALQNIKNAIDTANQEALAGVTAYAEQLSQLAASGIHAIWYSGQLSSLGSEVDAILPDTGIGASTFVTGPILVVDTANSGALSALQAIFGI